jgi:hypothetical protein
MRLFIRGWYNKVRPEAYKTKYIDVFEAYKRVGNTTHLTGLTEFTHSDQYKEKYFNSRVNRYAVMGKVRKFRKYRNVFKNGKLVCESRVVDLSKQKLSRIIRRESGKPYHYYSALPLPINSVSRIVGVVSKRKSSFRYNPHYEPDYEAKEILRKNNESYLNYTNDHGSAVLPGAWRFTSINLVDMCTPNGTGFTVDQMLKGIKSRRGLELRLPKVGQYDPSYILGLGVNPKANPGVNTSRVFGTRRNTSTGFTKGSAYNLAKAMMRGTLVFDKSLIHVGGREKRNNFPLFGRKDAKSRITCGQEDVPTLIGQSLVTPFNKSLQMMNTGFNWGGRINGRSNFKQLVNMLDCSDDDNFTNANTDFNGHDNKVDENKIVVAFALLRICFPPGKGIDNMFYYALSGMVFKRLVLPESGLIYEVTKGVLSGHSFTSIITTICAFITLSTSVNDSIRAEDKVKVRLQGAGDDWIMKLPKYGLHILRDYVNKYSGNTCDDMHIDSGDLKGVYPSRFPTFLKKHYLFGLLAWNVNELFTNLAYPTSTKMKLKTKIDNLIVMCVSGPFNSNIVECCKRLIIYYICDKYLFGRFTDSRKRGFYQIVFDEVYDALLNERDINKVLDKVPTRLKFAWYAHAYGGTDIIDIQDLCKMFIKEIDIRVAKSRVWMIRPTHYERHESVRRLKVFDLNKKFIPVELPGAHKVDLLKEIYKE